MLVAGLLAIPANLTAAVSVLGLFALANLSGWLIWRRRTSLSPYRGLQILIPVLGLSGIASIYVLDRAGFYESIQCGKTGVSEMQSYEQPVER